MDAMDVDWCLTCNKQTTNGKSYCSRQCKQGDDDQDFSYLSDDASSSSVDIPIQQHPSPSSRRHTTTSSRAAHRSPRRAHSPQQHFIDAEVAARTQWPGYNDAGIRAWRSAVPAGGAGASLLDPLSASSASVHTRPDFPLSRQRPAGPALCMDTTQPARTTIARSSSPISLPSPRADVNANASFSQSTYSLTSALAESIAPESVRPKVRTSAQAHALQTRPPFFENIARRFRGWKAPAQALNCNSPAEIFMQTTTTTTPATPSTNSPASPTSPSFKPRHSTNSKDSSGFTVRGGADVQSPERQVYAVRLPIALRSPLAIGDAELKESLTGACDASPTTKRGVWIAGREKEATGWAGYGPAYYEKAYRARDPVREETGDRSEREMREFEAWNARGRKTVRR